MNAQPIKSYRSYLMLHCETEVSSAPNQPLARIIAIEQHDREYGLAAFGLVGNESRSLAWPPRPTQFYLAREMAVASAETGLAQYRQSEWGHISQVETNSDGDIG